MNLFTFSIRIPDFDSYKIFDRCCKFSAISSSPLARNFAVRVDDERKRDDSTAHNCCFFPYCSDNSQIDGYCSRRCNRLHSRACLLLEAAEATAVEEDEEDTAERGHLYNRQCLRKVDKTTLKMKTESALVSWR